MGYFERLLNKSLGKEPNHQSLSLLLKAWRAQMDQQGPLAYYSSDSATIERGKRSDEQEMSRPQD